MTDQQYKSIMEALEEEGRKIRSSKEYAAKVIDDLGIRHLAPLFLRNREIEAAEKAKKEEK